MFPEAIAELEKALSLSNDLYTLSFLGTGYAMAGQREEAMKILEQLMEASKVRNVSSFGIALIYTCLGEKDQAFRWLERVYQERESANRINVCPVFDPLRRRPSLPRPAAADESGTVAATPTVPRSLDYETFG